MCEQGLLVGGKQPHISQTLLTRPRPLCSHHPLKLYQPQKGTCVIIRMERHRLFAKYSFLTMTMTKTKTYKKTNTKTHRHRQRQIQSASDIGLLYFWKSQGSRISNMAFPPIYFYQIFTTIFHHTFSTKIIFHVSAHSLLMSYSLNICVSHRLLGLVSHIHSSLGNTSYKKLFFRALPEKGGNSKVSW